MSSYDRNQSAAAAPPNPPSSKAGGPYVMPPPPAGYPTRDSDHQGFPQNAGPVETKSRGFWKGCCAGLCCCCALDICF